MKRLLATFLLLSSGLVLPGCSLFGPLELASATGTDPYGSESGVGGTGFLPGGEEDEGVGGTGIAFNEAYATPDADEGIGGTGIFGVISAFGSIVVNGVHIDYEPETSVSVDGEAGSSDDFAIGQTVAVEAMPMGTRYQARLVEIQHAVIGPVEAADPASREFIVLGQRIKAADVEEMPLPGQWVKVSGLRDDDENIVASRVELTDAAEAGLVRGIVTSGRDGFSLNGLPVKGVMPDVEAGDEVLLRGQVRTRGLDVQHVAVAPDAPFGGRMNDLLIDGAIRKMPDGSVYVAGHNWRLPDNVVAANGIMRPEGLQGRYLLRGPWRTDRLRVVPENNIRRDHPEGLAPNVREQLRQRGGTEPRAHAPRGLEWPPEIVRNPTSRTPGGRVDPIVRPSTENVTRPAPTRPTIIRQPTTRQIGTRPTITRPTISRPPVSRPGASVPARTLPSRFLELKE